MLGGTGLLDITSHSVFYNLRYIFLIKRGYLKTCDLFFHSIKADNKDHLTLYILIDYSIHIDIMCGIVHFSILRDCCSKFL